MIHKPWRSHSMSSAPTLLPPALPSFLPKTPPDSHTNPHSTNSSTKQNQLSKRLQYFSLFSDSLVLKQSKFPLLFPFLDLCSFFFFGEGSWGLMGRRETITRLHKSSALLPPSPPFDLGESIERFRLANRTSKEQLGFSKML